MADDRDALVSRLSTELLESERVREQLARETGSYKEQLVALRRENALLARSREDLAMQLRQARESLDEREREDEYGDEAGAGATGDNEALLQRQVDALQEQVRVLQNMDYPQPSGERQKEESTSQQLEANNRILLEELEAQEFEIERLFKERELQGSQLDDFVEANIAWKEQCEDLSKQNERLQEMLQESAAWSFEQEARNREREAREGAQGDSEHVRELTLLKDQVLQFERLYREEQALNAKLDNELKLLEVRKLELVEQKNDMQHTFVPILATIEDRLLKLQFEKNKSPVTPGPMPLPITM
mmetsp:Transcript_1319/g.3396  ORF Transcript_1319/g.3396 Transcript_1319/m.3396 type:complete len:303 (-) Transcript_1319:61-969(-)